MKYWHWLITFESEERGTMRPLTAQELKDLGLEDEENDDDVEVIDGHLQATIDVPGSGTAEVSTPAKFRGRPPKDKPPKDKPPKTKGERKGMS